jgi:hypothetical protein
MPRRPRCHGTAAAACSGHGTAGPAAPWCCCWCMAWCHGVVRPPWLASVVRRLRTRPPGRRQARTRQAVVLRGWGCAQRLKLGLACRKDAWCIPCRKRCRRARLSPVHGERVKGNGIIRMPLPIPQRGTSIPSAVTALWANTPSWPDSECRSTGAIFTRGHSMSHGTPRSVARPTRPARHGLHRLGPGLGPAATVPRPIPTPVAAGERRGPAACASPAVHRLRLSESEL